MPVLRLEFSLSPITSDTAVIVSRANTGAQKLATGVAEVGDGVERDIRHGLAEHDVEHQEVVDRRFAIANG